MSKNLKDFHHYKGNDLTKFEKVERKVMEMIITSKIRDNQREDSIVFALMHAAGCMQIGRVLAQKRKLNVDIASVASMIHDIYVIVTGKYKDHGKLGAPIAEKLLEEIGGFSDKEISTVKEAIAHHSEKEINSGNPYIELVKDVDAFDCALYKNAEGFYRLHKSADIFKEYVKRMKKVRQELGLPVNDVFR